MLKFLTQQNPQYYELYIIKHYSYLIIYKKGLKIIGIPHSNNIILI